MVEKDHASNELARSRQRLAAAYNGFARAYYVHMSGDEVYPPFHPDDVTAAQRYGARKSKNARVAYGIEEG
jgi:hypothetical protein